MCSQSGMLCAVCLSEVLVYIVEGCVGFARLQSERAPLLLPSTGKLQTLISENPMGVKQTYGVIYHNLFHTF